MLPECSELSRIGTPESYNCVRLGLPHVSGNLIRPMMCYNGDRGEDYRGTVSVTRSGRTCKPWHLNFGAEENDLSKDTSLMGGHNYCRNPGAISGGESQPWCYTNDPRYRDKRLRDCKMFLLRFDHQNKWHVAAD